MPLVDLPDDAALDAPANTELAPLPENAQLDAAPYHGMVLPVSRDASGPYFDPLNAGPIAALRQFFANAYSAARTPGDVYTGKTPIMANGGYNPDLINRGIDFTTLFTLSPAPGAIPTRQAAVAAPTATELKAAGSAGYNAARSAGLEIDPQIAVDTAAKLSNDLTRAGFGAKVAPQTHGILDEIANPPSGPGVIRNLTTMDDLEAIRRNLANLGGSNTEREAARRAVGEFDGILERLTPADVVAGPTSGPALVPTGQRAAVTQDQLDAIAQIQRDARANYAAAMRTNKLSGELDRANTGIQERADIRAAAANSGQNLDNALRQQVRSFLDKNSNLRGYSQDEIDALNSFVNPGFGLRNATRYASNLLGGGGGLGQGFAGTAATALGSYLTGNPAAGVAIGIATPTAGYALKQAQNALASRELQGIENQIAMRSPLGAQMQAAAPIVPDLRDVTALRLMLLGNQQVQPLAPLFGALSPPVPASVPQAVPGFI